MTEYEKVHEQVMQKLREKARQEREWLEGEVLRLWGRYVELCNRNHELCGLTGDYERPAGQFARKMSIDELYEERHRLTQTNWELAKQNYRLKKQKEA